MYQTKSIVVVCLRSVNIVVLYICI